MSPFGRKSLYTLAARRAMYIGSNVSFLESQTLAAKPDYKYLLSAGRTSPEQSPKPTRKPSPAKMSGPNVNGHNDHGCLTLTHSTKVNSIPVLKKLPFHTWSQNIGYHISLCATRLTVAKTDRLRPFPGEFKH